MPDNNKNMSAATDMLDALKSPGMRRIFRRILHQSNLMMSSYVKGDAQGMAFNEGLRAVGLWLKNEIDQADPEAFAGLLMEKRREND